MALPAKYPMRSRLVWRLPVPTGNNTCPFGQLPPAGELRVPAQQTVEGRNSGGVGGSHKRPRPAALRRTASTRLHNAGGGCHLVIVWTLRPNADGLRDPAGTACTSLLAPQPLLAPAAATAPISAKSPYSFSPRRYMWISPPAMDAPGNRSAGSSAAVQTITSRDVRALRDHTREVGYRRGDLTARRVRAFGSQRRPLGRPS